MDILCENHQIATSNDIIMYYFNLNNFESNMSFCESSKKWNERKKFFQERKLNFLISVKEGYERKLAAISASISKLEEQMNSNSTDVEP